MIKLNQIEAFVQVATEKSYRQAATKYGLSAAALSQSIKKLEQEQGVELLKRDTRNVELTPIGEQFLQQCQTLMQQVTDLQSLSADYKAEPKGLLKITYGNYFGEGYIVARLGKFMQQYPKITLELSAGENYDKLITGETDLLFGMIAPEFPNWVRKRILSTRYVICATPTYFQQHGTPKKPNDLYHHHYITHSRRVPPDNALYFKNNKTILATPIIRIDDGRDMIGLALQHIGFIKAPDFMVQKHLKSGRLIEVLHEYCLEEISVYLYYQSTKYLDPKIRCFIDFMCD